MRIYRLSASAEEDIEQILAWTETRFGESGRHRYEALLVTGLRQLASDPKLPGSIERPEIGPAIRTYHLRYSRKQARIAEGLVHAPRHFVLYRAVRDDLIGIGRVLHDAMEIERHLPPAFGDE